MGHTVLVIDDEPAVRNLISTCLEAAGYGVHAPPVETEAGSREASRAAFSGRYDLILLDLRLPLMDSTDLAERLHEAQVPSPVAIIAGFIPPELELRFSDLGIDHFIEKPFPLAILLSVVEEAITPSLEPH